MWQTLVTLGSSNSSCFTIFLDSTTSVCIVSFHFEPRIKSKMNSLTNWQEQGSWDRSDKARVGEWNTATIWQAETNSKMTWMKEQGDQHNFPTKHYCSLQSNRQKTTAHRRVKGWLQVSHTSVWPLNTIGHRYTIISTASQATLVWLST